MKNVLVLVLALSTLNSFAQKTAKPDAFAKSITPSDLKKRLDIVAAADMQGRETATEGQRKAAAYIESEFKSLGLQPGNKGGYQLFYNVYQDSLVNAKLQVNGEDFQMDKDFNPSVNNIPATMRFNEVVFVGANAGDSLKNANLAGRAVLIVGGLPQRFGRGGPGAGIYSSLLAKGVAAIISVGTNYPATTPASRKGFQSTSLFRRNITPQLFTVSENVAKAILGSEYESAKSNVSLIKTFPTEVLLDVQKTSLTAQSSDVIGVLPGTDLKDEYLVVSAHYDHLGIRNGNIYYGADDDGSGTVSILQIAQAFAKAKAEGKGPRRSIVFLANSGEEEGLWGSDYYTSHPTFPLEKTTADLNIDMIGRTDSSRKVGDSLNYVYVVGDDKLSTDLRTISEAANKKYLKMELDYKFNDPNDPNNIYFRSDHYNFAKHGVPIIFYYDGMLGADYHRPTDTPDKINYNLMAKRAQLVFYTAWEMANGNDMLKRDISMPIPTRRGM
ncbi:MAG: M28 family peptidase [Flavisolibacter sp.]